MIVDSSPQPFGVLGRDDVRLLIGWPQGTSVGRKRNLALKEASGEIITWFDDDDWQHPEKLSWLVEALRHGAPYAGSCRAWFVDLMASRCVPYKGRRQVFNSAGFRRKAVLPFRFPENLGKGSDTSWMRDLAARFYDKAVIIEREDLFFWLCHQNNVSNPAKSKRFPERLQVLKDKIGADAWGDTDEALNALRMRLFSGNNGQAKKPGSHVVVPPRRAEPRPQSAANSDGTGTSARGNPLPVSLMIKATVMDAPFLDVMVRHMITQARYSFTERIIVVDRRPAFAGKYRTRPCATDTNLDQILDRLLTDGIVDHVHNVDMTPAHIQDVMGHYFQHDADRVPTHAATGGPIYATLFGLELMTTDHVLQMDADILFYASCSSWVEQALEAMSRDPRLWLMMTHPGPPTGPQGQSLGPRNRRRATWDGDLQVWQFRSATTRYFLCDRQNLRNRLLPLRLAQGYAPLEQSISDALQRYGAFRGSLGTLSSWHLHVWYHGDPFPKLAPLLTKAIEAGRFPTFQRGEYDLRLDRPRDRLEWGKLLSHAHEHTFVRRPV